MNVLILGILLSLLLFSKDFDYKLKAIKIAKDTYLVEGKKEYFSQKNGGDISNSSFIVSAKGVIVIDTGSSFLYGKQLLKLIKTITSKKILFVINTHQHPDHFLGNQAFKDFDIFASVYTKKYIERNANEYILNLVNIVQYAMNGTEVHAPNKILKSKYLTIAKHKIKVLYLKGHTKDDIVLYDEYTKTLFASDLVFYNRLAATPHANIQEWIRSLQFLQSIDYKLLVPGHGEVSSTKAPLNQMISYLKYLDNTLKEAAKKGLTVFEILELKTPKEFQNISMLKDEFERSVINLYPKYEDEYLINLKSKK